MAQSSPRKISPQSKSLKASFIAIKNSLKEDDTGHASKALNTIEEIKDFNDGWMKNLVKIDNSQLTTSINMLEGLPSNRGKRELYNLGLENQNSQEKVEKKEDS